MAHFVNFYFFGGGHGTDPFVRNIFNNTELSRESDRRRGHRPRLHMLFCTGVRQKSYSSATGDMLTELAFFRRRCIDLLLRGSAVIGLLTDGCTVRYALSVEFFIVVFLLAFRGCSK